MRLAAAAVLIVLMSGPIAADEFGPWSADQRHPVMADPDSVPVQRIVPTPGSNPFTFTFMLWSELLTRIDGPRCAHTPSCSAFAHQAIGRYGIPVGVWLALNRLMRGARSSVLRSLPQVVVFDEVFFLDTIEDNVFWPGTTAGGGEVIGD